MSWPTAVPPSLCIRRKLGLGKKREAGKRTFDDRHAQAHALVVNDAALAARVGAVSENRTVHSSWPVPLVVPANDRPRGLLLYASKAASHKPARWTAQCEV